MKSSLNALWRKALKEPALAGSTRVELRDARTPIATESAGLSAASPGLAPRLSSACVLTKRHLGQCGVRRYDSKMERRRTLAHFNLKSAGSLRQSVMISNRRHSQSKMSFSPFLPSLNITATQACDSKPKSKLDWNSCDFY